MHLTPSHPVDHRRVSASLSESGAILTLEGRRIGLPFDLATAPADVVAEVWTAALASLFEGRPS